MDWLTPNGALRLLGGLVAAGAFLQMQRRLFRPWQWVGLIALLLVGVALFAAGFLRVVP